MKHYYKKLEIWKRSISLATNVYETTKSIPDQEKFGLTSQIRRCSVSIPSNIAEGSSRNSNKEFKYFLTISSGSLFELQTQLQIAFNLKFISEDQYLVIQKDTEEIKNMIYVFMTKILK